MKKLAALFVVLISVGLAGCNTIHGLGQDIERGGEKLQGNSRDTQEKM
jgi:predicted small secreted protein